MSYSIVFIVSRTFDYEGESAIGVCSTKEEAREMALVDARDRCPADSYLIEEFFVGASRNDKRWSKRFEREKLIEWGRERDAAKEGVR